MSINLEEVRVKLLKERTREDDIIIVYYSKGEVYTIRYRRSGLWKHAAIVFETNHIHIEDYNDENVFETDNVDEALEVYDNEYVATRANKDEFMERLGYTTLQHADYEKNVFHGPFSVAVLYREEYYDMYLKHKDMDYHRHSIRLTALTEENIKTAEAKFLAIIEEIKNELSC